MTYDENSEKTIKTELTNADVSNRWGIPLLVDLDDHEAWKIAFDALKTATLKVNLAEQTLHKAKSIIDDMKTQNNLFKKTLEIYERELSKYDDTDKDDRLTAFVKRAQQELLQDMLNK